MSWEENEEYLPSQQPPPVPRTGGLNPNAFSFNPSASTFTPSFAAAPVGGPGVSTAPVSEPWPPTPATAPALEADNVVEDHAHEETHAATNGPVPAEEDGGEVSSSHRAG